MGKTNIISCEHLARTNEPEAKLNISNIFWLGFIAKIELNAPHRGDEG
jgi:hypothetical protein